jgi:hypothetical protein
MFSFCSHEVRQSRVPAKFAGKIFAPGVLNAEPNRPRCSYLADGGTLHPFRFRHQRSHPAQPRSDGAVWLGENLFRADRSGLERAPNQAGTVFFAAEKASCAAIPPQLAGGLRTKPRRVSQ